VDPQSQGRTDVPAHLTIVDGQATLVRDGRLEPAEPNQILLGGDRLRTSAGRLEIRFADNSALAVDEDTTLDLLSDSLVRLVEGRLRITISRSSEDLDYRIDAAAGFAEIRSAGEYRVQTGKDERGKAEVSLLVYRGSAELGNDFGRTVVRAGRYALTSVDTEPSLPYTINSAAWDEFDQWVEALRESHVAQPAPRRRPYSRRKPVTTPARSTRMERGITRRAIGAVGIRACPSGGNHIDGPMVYRLLRLELVGIDHWAWPTYHYGRWGVSGAGWYWIPGTVWGPAWVSWGVWPGYVGWCPLGYNGYPVIGWGAVATPYYRDPWSAWTVMPAHAWTHNTWVNDHRVHKDGMPPGTRGGFSERRGGPMPTGSDRPRRELPPIGPPTAPRNTAVARSGSSSGGADRGGARIRTDDALPGFPSSGSPASGFPVSTRPAMAQPPQTRGGNVRTPDAAVASSSNGFPAARSTVRFPDATSAVPRATAPRADVSRADPRANSTSADVRQPTPSRATPRQVEPDPIGPVMRADPSRGARRVPDINRAAPAQAQPDRGAITTSGAATANGRSASSQAGARPSWGRDAPPTAGPRRRPRPGPRRRRLPGLPCAARPRHASSRVCPATIAGRRRWRWRSGRAKSGPGHVARRPRRPRPIN
jgi:hypothetical protein